MKLFFNNDSNKTTTLNNININVNEPKLIAIIGKIGSGKSSLISAILGELPQINDQNGNSKININGIISYVPQKAWMVNGSIRNNILFGNDYDSEWYKQVIYACSLQKDFKQMLHSDMTIIGEKGINLSGGQRARINLARAIYCKPQIILFDDPLSAVDSVVASKIFKNIMSNENGLMKNCIRLLVTHQTQFLNQCNSIIIMENGCTSQNDSLKNLVNKGVDIKLFFDEKQTNSESVLVDQLSDDKFEDICMSSSGSLVLRRSCSLTCPISLRMDTDIDNQLIIDAKNDGIIREEISKIGAVSIYNYISIFSSLNNSNTIRIIKGLFLLLLMFSAQILLTSCDYFIGFWSQSTNQSDSKYSIIYLLLTLIALILVLMNATIFFMELLNGAQQLHTRMFNSVLFAPMTFFESNPVGRILNRFSKDTMLIDELLPVAAYDAISLFFTASMSIILAGFTNYILYVFIIPIIILMIWIVLSYLTSSRVLKRHEATTRSPIFSHFSIMYSGLHIIRSFNKQKLMLSSALNMIDDNNRMYLMYQAISRWLGISLDVSTVIITSLTAFICIYIKQNHNNDISTAAVGSTLMYMLMLGGLLQFTVRQFAETENFMTSVERVIEYGNLSKEDKQFENNSSQIIKPSVTWPEKGHIKFHNLSAKYRPNLPLVLDNINISIQSNSKVGVVGRTGSGKSTLFLTIFRLLESFDGYVEIDGVNINTLSLNNLRSILSIIPQTPVLFSETLRYNIDPFNKYTDNEIYSALNDVQLYDFIIKKLPNKLDTQITENGNNFSVGQSQLICVARAILKNSKIICVDEATANVDPTTDELIQKILKDKFENKTVLTIAHRLNTILDYDKVLVLDKGKVIEYDNPHKLLKKNPSNDSSALFAKMYNEAQQHKQNM